MVVKSSWKTSVLGIGGVAVAGWNYLIQPYLSDQPMNFELFVNDLMTALPIILIGIGVFFARDDNKTSEEVLGAKTTQVKAEQVKRVEEIINSSVK